MRDQVVKLDVVCVECGKKEQIVITDGKIPEGWCYYGKLDVNFCKTDKFFWRPKHPEKSLLEDLEKTPNPCYDPEAKPVMVELWVCESCDREDLELSKRDDKAEKRR